VWLVPEYTQNANHACTSFEVLIQDEPDTTKKDLAKDTGGAYRYIVPVKQMEEKRKLTEIKLLRSGNAVDLKSAPGYDCMTSDLNKNRSGDWLYVIWKSVQTP
jgi:hypothetical protein